MGPPSLSAAGPGKPLKPLPLLTAAPRDAPPVPP